MECQRGNSVIIVTMAFMYKVVKAREENIERFGATSLVVRNRISLLSPPDATEGGILHNDTEHKKIISRVRRSFSALLTKMKSSLSSLVHFHDLSCSRQNRGRSNNLGR